MTTPYKHEPFTNFQDQSNVEEFKKALATVNEYLGKDYPLVINGEKVETEAKIVSINPADKEEVVGKVSKASQSTLSKRLKLLRKRSKSGDTHPLKKERPFCSAQLPKSAAESTNSPPCSSRKRENLGTKLMQIRLKRLTSWSIMHAK